MTVYKVGKNLERKAQWNNFKNGCIDGVYFIVVMALLTALVFGVLSVIALIITAFEYWSILVFLILGVIGNGIKEIIMCKWF